MILRIVARGAGAMAAAAALGACSSFSIGEPKEGATVKLPAPTTVVVNANPGMTGLRVSVDGNDVSGQIAYVSDARSQGSVALGAGMHTIAASATVPCWYCTPQSWQASFQTTMCVASQTSTATPSKTALSKGDQKVWVKTSDATVGFANDPGSLAARWVLIRLGGIASSTGLIQSVENTCLCMASTDAKQDTPIGLALCNAADATQQWQALKVAPFTDADHRIQNNGRSISDACLTEGMNGTLVQRACNDTPDQLWSVRDNVTMTTSGSPF